MNESSINRTAFVLGYLDGRKSRRFISIRQAQRKFSGLPAAAIECYLNGHDDGVRGDDTRYRLMSKQS